MNLHRQAWTPALAAAWRRERHLLAARPLDLAMLTVVPLLAVLLVWSLFWGGVPRGLPIAVLDGDHSAVSRQAQRFLAASPGLRLAAAPGDEAEAQALLRRGAVMAVLVIPEGLARDLKRGRAGRTLLLHNAQFATHSGLIQRDVRTALGTLSAGIELGGREKRGESPLGARRALDPLRASLTAAYNTGLDYEPFLAATLVPTLLHIFAMVAGAWMVGRELRDGTLGTAWGVVRHGGAWLLVKLGPAVLALVLIDALFFAGLHGGRGQPLPGPLGLTLLPVLGLHALMFAVYALLGAAAALAARSLRTALSAAGFITAPAFAFAGVGFPLLAMPTSARAWAEALPLTHVLQGQLAVLQVGAPAGPALASTSAALAVAAVLLAAWCIHRWPRLALDAAAWGRR